MTEKFDIDEVNAHLASLAEELRADELNDTLGFSPYSEWVSDIAEMHAKFGVNRVVRGLDEQKLLKFIEFRLNFLKEELNEAFTAYGRLVEAVNTNPADRKQVVTEMGDDIVDAMVDLCVVAIGTMDALDVDADVAWDRVYRANIVKEPGIKPERPNPLGLPDLIKPEGWVAPQHWDNIGLISSLG